jgi:hypothetical protein
VNAPEYVLLKHHVVGDPTNDLAIVDFWNVFTVDEPNDLLPRT